MEGRIPELRGDHPGGQRDQEHHLRLTECDVLVSENRGLRAEGDENG